MTWQFSTPHDPPDGECANRFDIDWIGTHLCNIPLTYDHISAEDIQALRDIFTRCGIRPFDAWRAQGLPVRQVKGNQ